MSEKHSGRQTGTYGPGKSPGQHERSLRMEKEILSKDDGRYIIFYSFEDEEKEEEPEEVEE
jgi:hypothetical protein